MDQSSTIMSSWEANASNWIATIDNNEIESRVLVTNNAIIQAISAFPVQSILDIGCGEGWLTRALQSRGMEAFGVDGIEALVNNAIEKGGEHYAVASFQDLAGGKYQVNEKYDAAVINFALLDETDSETLLKNISRIVTKGGLLYIQTLHPLTVAMQEPYVSGWKEGSWKGLKREFGQPYNWYFRTMTDWVKLFGDAGLAIRGIDEPLHPETQKPASLIFVLQVS